MGTGNGECKGTEICCFVSFVKFQVSWLSKLLNRAALNYVIQKEPHRLYKRSWHISTMLKALNI